MINRSERVRVKIVEIEVAAAREVRLLHGLSISYTMEATLARLTRGHGTLSVVMLSQVWVRPLDSKGIIIVIEIV